VALASSYEGLGVARWEDPAYDDADVLRDVKALRGFGPYAAEGMLGLLGRPRGLAVDSWVRAKLPGLLGRDAMTDAEIAEHFAPLGRWAGAGLWLELTRDWFGL
jgi:N-glycosylase/DNA lyase